MTVIDVFNDRYELVGTEDKKAAHARGLWHRTFSALAIRPAAGRVLLQKKAPGRYSFDRPDYADITVGGHYEAGEGIPDGIREVHEELGLAVAYADLHPIGLRQTAVTLATDGSCPACQARSWRRRRCLNASHRAVSSGHRGSCPPADSLLQRGLAVWLGPLYQANDR